MDDPLHARIIAAYAEQWVRVSPLAGEIQHVAVGEVDCELGQPEAIGDQLHDAIDGCRCRPLLHEDSPDLLEAGHLVAQPIKRPHHRGVGDRVPNRSVEQRRICLPLHEEVGRTRVERRQVGRPIASPSQHDQGGKASGLARLSNQLDPRPSPEVVINEICVVVLFGDRRQALTERRDPVQEIAGLLNASEQRPCQRLLVLVIVDQQDTNGGVRTVCPDRVVKQVVRGEGPSHFPASPGSDPISNQ